MSGTLTLIGRTGARQVVALADLLTAADRDRVRRDANAWIKGLRHVRYDGRSMRDRFTYRGDSLWWFTEIYLHKMRRLEQALATVFALERACERDAPSRLALACRTATEAQAARAFAEARGIALDVAQPPHAATATRAGALVGIAGWLSRMRPSQRPSATGGVAAFIHTAFWTSQASGQAQGRESYIGPVLDAIAARAPGDVRLVGVGPRRNFRTRQWWDPIARGAHADVVPIERLAPRRAIGESLALWRDRRGLAGRLVDGPGIRAAGIVGRYDLWPILEAELRDAALVQWTWSARAMDEARAALVALAPDVAVTYAEAGGWGRALVLEARRLSIPTVGLQHGFIYGHWLNYQHGADEMAASDATGPFPFPTETLLFDRHASRTLETTGAFPQGSVRVTGSARLDELAARVAEGRRDREALRRARGVGDADCLMVLAAKASEIGAYLPALFDAVRAARGVRLVIKPHPAEGRDAYQGWLAPGDPIVVDEPHADLGTLLAAADAMVTMNSTVAIDGLVLGVPALVIGLPNNLGPFVEAGVMIGADGADLPAALERLLYDRAAREAIVARGAAFAAAHAMRADGGAAAKAAAAVLALTAGGHRAGEAAGSTSRS